MGVGLTTVVIQVVAALTFVEGLKIIGVIDLLTNSINQLSGQVNFNVILLWIGSLCRIIKARKWIGPLLCMRRVCRAFERLLG